MTSVFVCVTILSTQRDIKLNETFRKNQQHPKRQSELKLDRQRGTTKELLLI
jgi:hypothetical protein